MKIRKMAAALFGALLLLGQSLPVLAADQNTAISFEGDAEKFVTAGEGADFTGMMPGEARTVHVTLTNNDSDEMSFYMSGEIPDGENIADEGSTKTAIYYLTVQLGNETIFDGEIGSEENAALGGKSSVGLEYWKNDTLLATLGRGESADVAITVTLDGDSVSDDYQGAEGAISLSFGVSTPVVTDPGTKTVVKNTIKEVKGETKTIIRRVTETAAGAVRTGDTAQIALYAGIAAAAAAVIVVLIVAAGKKKKREEHEE